MTLDEAIKHCEEKACGNSKCNQEHKQLAEWLRKLQRYEESNYFCCDKAMGYYGLGQYKCHVCGKEISS